MFILFGINEKTTTPLNPANLKIYFNACPKCSSDLIYKEVRVWVTVFFVPIIPIKSKPSIYHCENCNSSFKYKKK